MQNWKKICVESGIDGILNTLRFSHLAVDTVHAFLENLIIKLQPINAGHFLVFIFKSILKNYGGFNFDCLLRDLKYLNKSLALILNKQIFTGIDFMVTGILMVHDAKKILQIIEK